MKNLTFKSILKLLFTILLFCSLNSIKLGVPFAVSLLFPLLLAGFSPPLVLVGFALSALFSFCFNQMLLLLICALFSCLVFIVYKTKNRTIKFGSCIFTFVSLTPFLLADFGLILYEKLVYSTIIALLSPIFMQAFKLVFVKKFSFKWEAYETFSLCLLVAVFLYGLINFTCLWLVYLITLFTLLTTCYFYKNSKAFFCAILLSVPLALFTKKLEVVALFTLYCFASLLVIKRSKLLASVLVIILQTVYAFFSGALLTFDFKLLALYFLPFILFLLLPTKILRQVERRVKRFNEPYLTREILNSERAEISNKLYNLSALFGNLDRAILAFKPLALKDDELIEKMCDHVVFAVCEGCKYFDRCIKNSKPFREDIIKLLKVGANKGKVSLIDLSRDFSSYCYSTNDMISEINSLLIQYDKQVADGKKIDGLTNLIALESCGVSSILKQLAFEFAGKLSFDREFELDIFNYLCKRGVVANQILAVGDDLHLVLPACCDFIFVAELIGKKLGKRMRVIQKISLGKNLLAVFSPASNFDACFGVAQRTKKGSRKSGDTHSLARIDGNNFIAVICDGMGSGEDAYKNSQTAISLIEAFFKAKLDKTNCIELANKMLSLCAEDSFCALDLAVFDLENQRVDIIKIGATFGAYISGEEIKIIENNALPLGILQEITPTTATFRLLDGDMIIMLSDGVTDAFFSSTETVDFLQRERCLNPQTLADKIIDFAFDKSGGAASDDMTAVVIKIFRTN